MLKTYNKVHSFSLFYFVSFGWLLSVELKLLDNFYSVVILKSFRLELSLYWNFTLVFYWWVSWLKKPNSFNLWVKRSSSGDFCSFIIFQVTVLWLTFQRKFQDCFIWTFSTNLFTETFSSTFWKSTLNVITYRLENVKKRFQVLFPIGLYELSDIQTLLG